LRERFGDAISTIRVVVLRDETRSTIHRVMLRIPARGSIVDNFGYGDMGNLVAALDVGSGEGQRVYEGWGVEQRGIERHPDTNAELEGLVLPDWADGLELALRASRAFAAMPLQTWDLALTDRGPVMVELNDVSGHPCQVVGPPGMLDRELC